MSHVFKRLFADAPELLAALVNAVLDPATPIVVVAVKNPGIDPAELAGIEMRDGLRPSVLLGQELQLNLIELRKADRLGIGTGALADWIALFKHRREKHTMSHIADEAVRAARAKLEALSADAETRRLAFVRERALSDERTLLREAREDGWAGGKVEGKAEALSETAVNMIHNTSLDDPTIAAVTGLPVETVASLRRLATD